MNEQGMVVKRLLVLTFLMLVFTVVQASAEKRVALVIGNNDYTTLPDLNNAKKDAEGIATKLRGLQFDVILRTNAGAQSISRALAAFEKRIEKADVALVYYAGHGIESNGKNHLIPSDARIEVEEDLRFGSIDSQEFLHAMKRAGSPLNIVILDACRDNPLPRRSRSAARGLTVQAIPAGIKGTAIVYSAAPGQKAEDGPKGGYGVFTAALLKVLDEPGLKLEEVFKKTARLVSASTRGRQDPWFNSSVKGDFYFKPGAPMLAPTVSQKPPDINSWDLIKDSTDPKLFKKFLKQYPNSRFARLARLKVKNKKDESSIFSIFSLTRPTDSIEEMDATYVAVKTANLREKPSTKSKKVGQAKINSGLNVTGKVKGKNWYRVAHGGDTAFIFASLVKAIDATELEAWNRVSKSKDAKEFDEFLKEHPSGHFTDRAKQLKDALKPVQVAVVSLPMPNVPSPAKPAVVAPPKLVIPKAANPAVGIYPQQHKPGRTFKDCPGCPEMVVIPAGSFQMGNLGGDGGFDEKPVHRVTIPKPFAVGKYEVTQAEYLTVMGSNPSYSNGEIDREILFNPSDPTDNFDPNSHYHLGNRYPVENVSWIDAQEFVTKLRVRTGKKYRLLSEAEWEYVARAGTKTKYPCGDVDSCLRKVGWYVVNSKSRTHRVGGKEPNAFGLHDLQGNISEWVEDCWNNNYNNAPTDGSVWNGGDCSRHVIRGGSWDNEPLLMRSAFRDRESADTKNIFYGFRIARDLDENELKASNTNQPKQVAIVTPPVQYKTSTPSNILPPGTPDELYLYAFNIMNNGKYEDAMKAWKGFLAKYGDDKLAPYAHFWLGKTHYNLKKYRHALKSFYASFKANHQDSKAPETLLMLGKSLVKLNKQKEACLTFKKLEDGFPNAFWIRQTLDEERKRSSCGVSGQITPTNSAPTEGRLRPKKVAVVTPPKPTVPSRVKSAVGIYPQRYKPGDTFKDCPKCPNMVVISAGSFQMGDFVGGGYRDEFPVHNVTISKPFAVGKYEVTQAEYRAVMESNLSQFKGDLNPVETVSWQDALRFVRKMSTKLNKKYRLLSEAEWEYVARAGTTTKFYCGNDNGCLGNVSWDDRNSGFRTHPVGGKEANAFGLHDTHGNVSEWVEDCWNKNYNGAPTDGSVWNAGDCSRRVIRGGSYTVQPWELRSARRGAVSTTIGTPAFGFRIARDLDESELKASNTNQPKQVAIDTPPQQSQTNKQSNILPEGTPKEQYRFAFKLLGQRKYYEAEAAWKEFIEKNVNDPLWSNAQYWLGETYYVRKQYKLAARVFSQGIKASPKGPKAADMLLKLGMSLDNLGERVKACGEFLKLKVSFPGAAPRILLAVNVELKRADCINKFDKLFKKQLGY
jgi:tol-pal system protein YbgF